MEYILLTGGTGFIGSHTAVELINRNYNIIIVDNLSNSDSSVVDRIKKITGKDIIFFQCDVSSEVDLGLIFSQYNIATVIHFAAFKAVAESVADPLKYYQNNIVGLINLLQVMKKFNCGNIIFSSSATVYGDPESLPITESSKTYAINPYGQTKLFGEQILTDMYNSDPTGLKYNIIILRYFNPVGSHCSGLLGESPNNQPSNLFPYILDVINGVRPHLNIYGSDYNTHDGTAIRDYIHVVDLAKGHVKALDSINGIGLKIYNLGTGRFHSVLDVVNMFNIHLSNNTLSNNTLSNNTLSNNTLYKIKKLPIKLADRRQGDAEIVYADCNKARRELDWVAEKSLNDMVKDSIFFQKINISN